MQIDVCEQCTCECELDTSQVFEKCLCELELVKLSAGLPYSGFYLPGPNFCDICEVLTSSQILILKLLFYFREPATVHVILASGYHI